MTVRDYTRRARSVSIEFSQLIRAAGALDRRTLGYWQVDLRLGGPPHEPAELYRPAEAGRSAWRSRRYAPGATSAAARATAIIGWQRRDPERGRFACQGV